MKRIMMAIPVLFVTLTCYAGVVQQSGVKGGIVVHLGCGDGQETALLASDNNCLVHGLDLDADSIRKAKAFLRSKNLYGRVTVSRFDGSSLPYGNQMINLLVADRLGDVPREEVMRVLTPGGVAMIDGKKTVKPWPKDIDTWPQYLNKADNNAVAMDTVVGPPRRIQWIDEPTWSRSHMGISTVTSVVSAGGRLFSIEDRSLPDNPFLPGIFMYVARDAFNGRTLWTRKIERWESITVYIKCLPTQQQRRMVATEDVLYCTPVLEGPLAALDAATGETLRTYDDLTPVQEVAYDQGILFINVGERFNAAAYNQTHKKSNGTGGTPGEPFNGSGFRRGYAPEIKDKATPTSVIVAIDPTSGRELWRTKSLTNYTGASFAVKGDAAVYQTSEGLFCVNPKTGQPLWDVKTQVANIAGHDSHTPGTMPNTVIITEDNALAVNGKTLTAYSLADGEVLWENIVATNYESSADLFYVNGLVWIGGQKSPMAFDAQTGEMVRSHSQKITGPMSHDRCYRNMITKKYFINSKTGGADLLDLETGDEFPNHWTRGTCGMGVLPANGLLYSTPYSCTCSVGDMLPGMNAYSADAELLKTCDSSVIQREARLEKGAAYGKIEAVAASPRDWPTYRGDAFRSGMADGSVSTELKLQWRAKLPTTPTACTIAGEKVFVSDVETHTLYALDRSTGETAWTFTADGIIDSPPTYYRGMVLFGGRDGWLYCLRASDGELAWRFKDLPERLIGAFGRLESAWPIAGSVLVLDDKVYAAAGRTSFLDGGMFLYCLDPTTGTLLASRSAYGPFADKTGFPIGFKSTPAPGGKQPRGKKKPAPAKFVMPGFKNDVLTSDGANIYLRHAAFDRELENSETSGPHLMPLAGFLDPRVQHRTGFILNNQFQWWRNEPKDIMISDGQETYAVAGFQSTHNHAYFDPRTSAYTLIGDDMRVPLPINGRAMAKSGDIIFVAGQPMKLKDPIWQNYVASYDGKLENIIVAVSATDGREIARYKLPSDPVWDSLSIADGSLYIALTDGSVLCLGK